MAGLADFQKKQSNEEPVSSVPRGNSEYAEPYEPSLTRGIIGLGLAGAGAVALRTPIGRALDKLSKLTTPKAPVSRITEPVDEVEEILAITPTRVDRGREMTKAQTSFQEQIRQETIARSNELKKIAYNNPLSRGGATNRIGSSLWDYIARHPVAGSRKATEWINDFKSSGPGSFKTGNPDFKNISQAVKRDELWDSNLLQFDKDGNVIGGFLKTAAEKNLPLSKMDLLYIVEKAPVNNLVTRKLTMNTKVVDEYEDLGRVIRNDLDDLRARILANPETMITANTNRAQQFSTLIEQIGNTKKDIAKRVGQVNKSYRIADDDPDFDVSPFKDIVDNYKDIVTRARQLNLTIPEQTTNLVNASKVRDTELFRKLQLMQTQKMMPRYGSHTDYRIRGGDEYFENVVYYPKPLPMGQKLPSEYNRHYSELPNQVYHVRGSVRSAGQPNQKVMVIDEIQSDYNQKLRNTNFTRDKVVNTFGTEVEFFASTRKLEKFIEEMRAISKKGINMTTEDIAKFRQIRSDFDEIKKNTINASNITGSKAKEGIPFLPLYGKENWGSHALKNTIKDAADRGNVDWVAINPVERLHHAKRKRFLGDLEFYGTREGKAGFKNYGKDNSVFRKTGDDGEELMKGNTDPNKIATLPAIMRKLAKEYNSEVKTINVAKSDPSKPFKLVKQHGKHDKAFGLNPDNLDEHVVAFRYKDEADAFAKRYTELKVKEIREGDPRLYYEAFAIRVSGDMKTKPFKAYQEGGLVVNIFA
jgi:hypothetical protein